MTSTDKKVKHANTTVISFDTAPLTSEVVLTLTVARHVTGPRFENFFKLVSLSALEQREIHVVSHVLCREEHIDKLVPKASDVTRCAILRFRDMHVPDRSCWSGAENPKNPTPEAKLRLPSEYISMTR